MALSNSSRAFRLMMPCLRTSAGKIAIGLLCAGLMSAVKLSIPWTIKLAIDDVFPSRNTTLLMALLGGLALAFVLKNAFIVIGRRVMLRAGETTALSVRRLLFSHLQSLSVGYHKSHKPGESLSRVTGDVATLESFVEIGVPKTANTLLMMLGVLVIIFITNPVLAAVSLVVLPMHLLLYMSFKQPIKSGNRRMRENESGISSGLVESLLGVEAMTASAAEDHERQKFYDRANNLLGARLRLGSLQLWQKVLADVAVGIGTVGVFYYGGRQIMATRMTIGEFTAFISYLGMLYPLSLTLMTQMGHTLGAMSSAERVMDVLETEPDVKEAPDAAALPQVNGSIAFDNVSFSYGERSHGLRALNFAAEAGDVVAVIGPEGTGKSTLAYLLARFYDVRNGAIYLDGVPLDRLPLRQLRNEVGIAFQEPFLFSGSLADNIRYSKPDASAAEVMAAADAVGLAPLIERLPDGIDTMIGENGIQLSLGQKHRIDMARALIKNPRILVLDSVLADVVAEDRREQERVFHRISEGRTTFVINPPAHVLDQANKVVRLQRSGLAEVEERR
ncbi:MAG TPA: ABC transporter ATP-binding protein [Planctomycetota bacterium]|nr:ABC transporter ATP-binding protein [Planctomycetota bacterium]